MFRLLTLKFDGEKVKSDLNGVTMKLPPRVELRKAKRPSESVVVESEREPLRFTVTPTVPLPDESMTRPEIA